MAALHGAGWQTIAPNFPGFAGAPLLNDANLTKYADMVVQHLDAAGVEKTALLGLSLGGYVAFRILEKHPNRISQLVLADTRAGNDAPANATKRLEQATRAEQEGLAWLPEIFLAGALAKEAPETVRQTVRELIGRASVAGVAAALRAMATRPDSVPQLFNISVPTLVLCGEEDTLTPVAEAELMTKSIAGAKLVLIPGAGHLSNLEKPELFNAALLNFLT